jgi:hypothetical protein
VGLAAPGAPAVEALAELRAAVVAALLVLRAEPAERVFALEVAVAQPGLVLFAESSGG